MPMIVNIVIISERKIESFRLDNLAENVRMYSTSDYNKAIKTGTS